MTQDTMNVPEVETKNEAAATVEVQEAEAKREAAVPIKVQEVESKTEAAAAARAAALRKIYRHYFFSCCQTVMPFSQKSQLILSLNGYKGNIGKTAMLAASLSSVGGIIEFIICPILGKLSDANGRKAFMKLGPLADIIGYGLVWANPSVGALWLQALLGTPMNTFAGTTCAGASIMDIYRDAPHEMGAAFGGLLGPVGAGLIVGPLVGQAMVKLGRGRPQMAYLGAALFAVLQLLNVQSMVDTLPHDRRKPFAFALMEINPVSFLKLFTTKSSTVLAKLSLMAGFLQKADEGKNLADLHQLYSLNNIGLSQTARGNFVSWVGMCVLVGARTAKVTLNKLGGHGHTTFSNLISIFALAFFAIVPLRFKNSANNWWPMFLGLLISALGWNANSYAQAQGAVHAEAVGIGNGEYSAMLANMRSIMSCLAPTLYAKVYMWSTSGGRNMPGLSYMISAVFKVAAELCYQSMSADAIENKL